MAEHRLGNATKTTLEWGSVRAPVSLYKTVKELKDTDSWDTAGPNGGRLHLESRAVAAPVLEREPTDPLAGGDEHLPFGGDGQDVPDAPEFKPLPGREPPSPGGIAGGVLDGTYDPGGPPSPAKAAVAEPPITEEAIQERTFDPATDSGPLPPLPDSAYPPDAAELPESEPAPTPGAYTQVLVEEGSGAVVQRGEVRRGIRIPDDVFVDLTEHLERADREAKMEVLRVVSFIRVEQVRRERIQGSYYLAPGDKSARTPLHILLLVMKEKRRVAVVKWTKRKNQAMGVVVPGRGGALLVLEMAWERAWIEPTPRVLEHLKSEPAPQMVEAAGRLVDAMADSVASLDELEDDAWATKRDLRAYVEEHAAAPELQPEEKEAEEEFDLAALFNASADRG